MANPSPPSLRVFRCIGEALIVHEKIKRVVIDKKRRIMNVCEKE